MNEQSDRKGDRLKGPVTESVLPSQLRCGGVLNATLEIRNLRSATIQVSNLQSARKTAEMLCQLPVQSPPAAHRIKHCRKETVAVDSALQKAR